MLPYDILKNGAAEFGLSLTEQQQEMFNDYYSFLVEYNEQVNLTSITAGDEVAIKHFVDSIAVLKFVTIPENASLIDVGTGAGFPGVPLKIIRPDIDLTLLDSLNKRLIFLQQLGDKLNLTYKTVHHRAEEAGINPDLRERFDFTTSRAVASLAALCEYCMPLLKVGGIMLALKGPNCDFEINKARTAIDILGKGKVETFAYTMPDDSRRTLIAITKTAPTPKKFPRQRVKISDKPI